MWEGILEMIKQRADAECPYRNINVRDDTSQWIPREVLSEIHHTDFMYDEAKARLGTSESWNLFRKK